MATRIPYEQLEEIPGWFRRMDMELFRLLLDSTEEKLGGGDLAELGVYLGKSAALIGCSLQPGETFTVIDLFSAEAPSEDNQAENDEQYAELSQEAFERYYRTIHDELPVVVRAPSQEIVEHAGHGTHRFVHIDASHLYEHVVADIDAARTLLKPGGIVVFDDYRTLHAPGVGAAIWRASRDDLTPFAVSMNKLYATFGDAEQWVGPVKDWLEGSSYWRMEVQQVAGRELVRVRRPAPKAKSEAPSGAKASETAPAHAKGKRGLLSRITGR
jgi:predicted O-methyltransferase YrrM